MGNRSRSSGRQPRRTERLEFSRAPFIEPVAGLSSAPARSRIQSGPAPAMNQDVPLADFAPGPRKGGVRPFTRATGAGLTACVYACFALIALLPPPLPPDTVMLSETTVRILPDMPPKMGRPTPPTVPVRLLRPHVQSIAPPDFTVASVSPPSPAPLPPAEPLSTPLLGGTPRARAPRPDRRAASPVPAMPSRAASTRPGRAPCGTGSASSTAILGAPGARGAS